MASSSSTPRWNYDVFLSFRGETRKNFTDHLYAALVQGGIHTFRDEDELKRGEAITTELLKTIEESRIAIIVLSPKYASSGWCLDELVKILECQELLGMIVLPIFYGVDPSDVRYQTGSYAEALAELENNKFKVLKEEKMHKWKTALTKVANFCGWNLQDYANGYEARLIQKILKEICSKLNPRYLNVATHPVGIESRVDDILLRLKTNDVHFIGICGMGGIGKTTITKAVYNRIFENFEGSSFLGNVREVSSRQPDGLVCLQKQLISDIFMEREDTQLGIYSSDRGMMVIKERLCRKRVLVVLDDVDQPDQLRALAGEKNWFGSGSKIIITARNESPFHEIKMDEIYKAIELSKDESIELFSRFAFGERHPKQDYVHLSNSIVDYAKGIPLVLKVLGSLLCDKRSISEWTSALEKLKAIPHDEIQKTLQISFDVLDDTEKNIFLDIACFFIGMDRKFVVSILDSCNFFATIGISVLIRRCLITIENEQLMMHDLLRDMGREIVRKESIGEPGKRSRLWAHEDVLNVLRNDKGTKKIEGLLYSGKYQRLSTKVFEKMKKLRLLRVDFIHLEGDYQHLPKQLKWLRWNQFPLESIPADFNLKELVVLEMRCSNLRQVWAETKLLEQLKVLDLSHCFYLIKTPDFSKLPNLEKLILVGCENLVKVDKSIRCLKKLVILNLSQCCKLINLPSTICYLESLECLVLSHCPSLNIGEQLRNIESLENLKVLDLAVSNSLIQTPNFSRLTNLEVLVLCGCENLVEVHESIGYLEKLVVLNLDSCSKLRDLPNTICKLKSLKELILPCCSNPGKMPYSLWEMQRSTKLQDNAICIQPARRFTRTNRWDGPVSNFITVTFSVDFFPSFFPRLGYRDVPDFSIPSKIGSLLSSLVVLDLSYNNVCRLPDDIKNLTSLKILELSECKKLQFLPKLPSSLEALYAFGCTSLANFSNPGYFPSLTRFYLTDSKIGSLPDSISCCPKLTDLVLSNSTELKSLPELPPSLKHLVVDGCVSIETFPNLSNNSNLVVLKLRNCNKLSEIQGLDGLSLRLIDMGSCNGLTETFRKNLIQVLFNGEKQDIFLPGSNVSELFSDIQVLFKGDKPYIFLPGSNASGLFHDLQVGSWAQFEVSQYHNIQGLIVCAIYTVDDPEKKSIQNTKKEKEEKKEQHTKDFREKRREERCIQKTCQEKEEKKEKHTDDLLEKRKEEKKEKHIDDLLEKRKEQSIQKTSYKEERKEERKEEKQPKKEEVKMPEYWRKIWMYWGQHFHGTRGQDEIWLGYRSNTDFVYELEGRNLMEVEVDSMYIHVEVKKCGIHPVYESNRKDSQSDYSSSSPCASSSIFT
uniref:TIR domain-containing protein n=1 Tax=Nelumbo nucifera TaxID=4432 RepID=A0A822ZH29_NELNU|nr:TPA_asm: hypothetical protein HUJ06_001211 [Nelumbo nucifera]